MLNDLLHLSEWLSVEPPSAGDGGGSGGAGDGSGTSAGSDGGQGEGGQQGENGNGAGEGQGDGKTFTQAEIDKIVADRMARAEKQWTQKLEEAAERAKMDEAERLKAEKADAETAAETARREALEARVETTGERLALRAKVAPERVARFVEIAKLTGDLDAVTADGKPDEDALQAKVEQTLKDWPEFKADDGKGKPPDRSGGEMNGHNGQAKPSSLEQAFAAKMQ